MSTITDARLDPFTDEERRELGGLLGRVNAARRFPENTDAAARHVQIAAETLAANEQYRQFDDDRASIAASMLATVAALYEARTELSERRSQEAAGWQPIETCPDQKWVMGWAPEHGVLVVKHVEPNGTGGEHGDFVWATPENSGAGYWAEDFVTHWQPLPAPPREAANPSSNGEQP